MSGKIYTRLKKLFRKIIHSIGFDVIRHNVHTSESVLLQTIIDNFNIRTIIDVGANEGQYALELIEGRYQGQIYSFEPIKTIFANLEKQARPFKNWNVFNQGIGSNDGEMTIYVSKNLTSSSVLPVTKSSLEAEPNTTTTHTEQISITTLDSFLKRTAPFFNEALLKLDIQGYELEALKGARNSLQFIKLIQVELSLVALYEGSPLYKEVIAHIENNGFELYSIIPGFMDAKTGRLLQFDGIFLRKQENHFTKPPKSGL